MRPCVRCGQMLPGTAATCTRCGAVQPVVETPPSPAPAKAGCVARGGYVLAAIMGGLFALLGVIVGGMMILDQFDVFGGALALTLLVIGIAMLWHAVYALIDPAGTSVTLWPAGVWIGTLAGIWVPASLAILIAPQAVQIFMPFLIVLAALLPSLSFMSTALHGLHKPAGRMLFDGKFGPSHAVYLTGLLGATMSTTLAILSEVVAGAVIAGIMLAAAYALGDKATFERLIGLANDLDTDALEDLIGTSPVIFAGLFANLSVSAPLIEETVKGLPVLLFASRSRLSERTMILLGATAGIGFAFVENIGYLGMSPRGWPLLVIFRTCAATMHGVSSGFVGRGLYRALGKGAWHMALLDFALAIGIHGGWNFLSLIIVWFGYKGMAEGVLFVIAVGLLPLAVLFGLLARWGIWVSENG